MFRVEYFCHREGSIWKPLKGGFLGLFPQSFSNRTEAELACNGLVWRYHSARVIDPWGNVVYQI